MKTGSCPIYFVFALLTLLTAPQSALSQSNTCTAEGQIVNIIERPPAQKDFKVESVVTCWDCQDKRGNVDAYYKVECTFDDGETEERKWFFGATTNPRNGNSWQHMDDVNGCMHDRPRVTHASISIVVQSCRLGGAVK